MTEIKNKMLNWANQFSIFIFLDSNEFKTTNTQYECLLACNVAPCDSFADNGTNQEPLGMVQQIHNERQDWMFGHIGYDLKNTFEPKLFSRHPAKTGFPLLHFFIPATVCHINKEQTELTIESFTDPGTIYEAIINTNTEKTQPAIPTVNFKASVSREQYLETIAKLRRHIADGDCYEINFCNEGFCEGAEIDSLQVFQALNRLSPAPFAAYYKFQDLHLMCASPERYLLKTGNLLIAQPMKGTARRDANAEKDQELKQELAASIKERAENVMITDLVRNDLARCCEPGSIHVTELFGIYSFPQVHQMVSTVCGTMRGDVQFTDSIRHSFPMGSMTGAPKFMVMQLIDEYEQSRRELFSGSVGYITPQGNFDFNVIIRSLFYNAATNYLCYQTGGAITYDSIAEQEWEETRLKAWAMERIFSGSD